MKKFLILLVINTIILINSLFSYSISNIAFSKIVGDGSCISNLAFYNNKIYYFSSLKDNGKMNLMEYDLTNDRQRIVAGSAEDVNLNYKDNGVTGNEKYNLLTYNLKEGTPKLAINDSGNTIYFIASMENATEIKKSTRLSSEQNNQNDKASKIATFESNDVKDKLKFSSTIFSVGINNGIIKQIISSEKRKGTEKRRVYNDQKNQFEEVSIETDDFIDKFWDIHCYKGNKLIYTKKTNDFNGMYIYDLKNSTEKSIALNQIKKISDLGIAGPIAIQNNGNEIACPAILKDGQRAILLIDIDSGKILVKKSSLILVSGWSFDDNCLIFAGAAFTIANINDYVYNDLFNLQDEYKKYLLKASPETSNQFIGVDYSIWPAKNEIFFVSYTNDIYSITFDTQK